jgi:1-acyl-sn-glycerol-3-phosphate acyltransferase
MNLKACRRRRCPPRAPAAANLAGVDPVYRTVIGIARCLFFAEGLKFTVTGGTNIPGRGGAVIVINHTGYMDFTYAGYAARIPRPKRYIRFMAKNDVFVNKISGPIMRALRHIPVDRAAGGDSYREAVARLRKGQLVGVFPEATISRSFEIKDFKTGAARMAIEAGAPVIPLVIWGSQRVWTKGFPKHLGRTKTPILIDVGAPIAPDLPADELTDKLHQQMQGTLARLQQHYPHPAGAYWVPAKLGGGAPTLEEANELDRQEAEMKRARRRE